MIKIYEENINKIEEMYSRTFLNSEATNINKRIEEIMFN